MSLTASAGIEVDDLVREFKNGPRAVDGIHLQVAPGEIYGFLGPNGAGKSTTVLMLTTLLPPTAGTARVAGHDILREGPAVRAAIGAALQEAALDPLLTARDHMRLQTTLQGLPKAERRKRGDELIERVGLSDAADRKVGGFSGGMKRRLDLASALMHRPQVLILDEPTEGLDPQSRTALWEELERINQAGTAMLLTTHYMEEADRLCSRLAIIDDGKIVIEGQPAELKRSIGADTVILQLDAGRGDLDQQRAEARRLLDGMVLADEISEHPLGLSLAVPNASAAIPSVLRRLEGEGLRIAGLQMSQPSLDNVFLKYTGRHIRAEAADQPILMGW
jgi:ABC-2 type transport system ATP-binding protein